MKTYKIDYEIETSGELFIEATNEHEAALKMEEELAKGNFKIEPEDIVYWGTTAVEDLADSREEKALVMSIIDEIWDEIHQENYNIDNVTELLNERLKKIKEN